MQWKRGMWRWRWRRYNAQRSKTMAKKSSSSGTLFGKPRSSVIKHPGAFSAKAKSAGMSTSAFAQKVTAPGSKASTQTKRQGNLAKTFAKMRKSK